MGKGACSMSANDFKRFCMANDHGCLTPTLAAAWREFGFGLASEADLRERSRVGQLFGLSLSSSIRYVRTQGGSAISSTILYDLLNAQSEVEYVRHVEFSDESSAYVAQLGIQRPVSFRITMAEAIESGLTAQEPVLWELYPSEALRKHALLGIARKLFPQKFEGLGVCL